MNPTEVVKSFFAAIARGAYDEAVALLEPSQLPRFQQEQLAHTVAWLAFQDILKGPGPHPSGFGSSGTVSQEELVRRADAKVPGYRGVETLRDLCELRPEEFMARRLESSWLLARYFHGPAGELVRVPLKVLGEVYLTPDIAYVVYVHDYPPSSDNARVLADAPHPEVLPVFRKEERWFVGLNVEVMMAGPEHLVPDSQPQADAGAA
jgi:hypothetical protein